MHLLGIPILILQAICLLHAVKTGRTQPWLWIILFVPGLGCVIYFIAEILPGLQRSPTVRRVGADLATAVDPGRDIRQLEEELDVADTVGNRRALAQGYLAAGRCDEAIELYRSCMKGVFKDDLGLSLELAHALFLNGGARLAVEGSPVLEQLRQLEQLEVRVLVCGTCLDHFGARDRLAAGRASNMYEIVDLLSSAERVLRP